MKTFAVLCLLCATAYGFPASLSDDSSDESVLVNPVGRKGMPSVVEVDVGDSDEDSFFFPSFFRPIFYNPFSKIRFGGFSNLFQNSFFGWNSIFQRPPPDAKITNSTSTTKIVDGHKITVNATTYENEKNGAVFQYEVIEVSRVEDAQPEGDKSGEEAPKTDGEETTTKNNEASDTKNDNNSLDNEVYREEWDQGNVVANNRGVLPETEATYENFDQFDSEYIDLSNDIVVNEIAEQAARESGSFSVPPDVEVFADPERVRYYSPQRRIHHVDRYYSNWQFPIRSDNFYSYNYERDRLSHRYPSYSVQYYPERLNYYERQRIPKTAGHDYRGRFHHYYYYYY